MRIADLQLRAHVRRYDGRLRSTQRVWREKQTCLVFLVAENGVHGVGEAWCENNQLGPVVQALRGLGPLVVGRRIDAIGAIRARVLEHGTDAAGPLYAALSGR